MVFDFMFHQEKTSLSSDTLSSFVFTLYHMKNRIVHINDRHVNMRKRFANNAVHTTKYSLLSFLPVFLFHQFRRPANIFFLFIMCIEVTPIILIHNRSNIKTQIKIHFIIF